jgi:molybdopterin-guanine dinucleotide biosynthesis protein A
VGEVIISANRNLERYAALGYTVVPDETADFAGPLAGVLAGMAHARFNLVCTVPCDSPALPPDLVERLQRALLESVAEVAVARTAERAHPVFALYRLELRTSLAGYLGTGARAVDAWLRSRRHVEVSFDDAGAFLNINSPEDLDTSPAPEKSSSG